MSKAYINPKIAMNGVNQLIADLGFDVEHANPDEFEPMGPNVVNMPISTFVKMTKTKAIKVHINNLFATYTKEEVLNVLEKSFGIKKGKLCLK
jgi:hypothetical protein